MTEVIKESNWYSFEVCVSCKQRIDPHFKNGICPKCGHESYMVCDTEKVILKCYTHARTQWWKFWEKRPKTYVGRDEFSCKWLEFIDNYG